MKCSTYGKQDLRFCNCFGFIYLSLLMQNHSQCGTTCLLGPRTKEMLVEVQYI